MPADTTKIAESLGAKVVTQVPDTGGGVFGAARLARLVEGVYELTAYPDEEVAEELDYRPVEFPVVESLKVRVVDAGRLTPPSYPEQGPESAEGGFGSF